MNKTAKLREAFERLDAFYAKLPTVACQGKCAIACGRVPLTALEARRLQLATHTKPRTVIRLRPDGSDLDRCVYLTDRDRCRAYAVRPLMCRVWGVLRELSCMHGCVPDRWLTALEFRNIALDIQRFGGGRLLETSADGAVPSEHSFRNMPVTRSAEEIEENSERVRHLRALHGGRILFAGR